MKSFLVIGLGRVGRHLTDKLVDLGNEVMVLDQDEERVARISNVATAACVGDCQDEQVLASLGVRNFDACFVCISDDFQASLEATATLKDLGAKCVVARADREKQIKFLKKIGADYVAHGSTGAGNDQVRFDLTFQILAPEIGIITPTRDMTLTREYEIEYLRKHGFEADFKKMEYSINKGLWGTSIGGKETLHSEQTLPESAYPSQITATGEESLKISFECGEISAVNGKPYADKVEAIRAIEAIASKYGIGRDMHIGDTIIGIKGRVGFEAAAPIVIIAAHKMLEKHTLTKWQQYWKDQVGTWYGMFLHEAQYLEPVMRDIEAMLTSSQRNVTGTVELILRPYCYTLVGVDSTYDLMKTDFGEYGEVNKAWTADDVKGFTKILGNQIKIYYNVQKRNGK